MSRMLDMGARVKNMTLETKVRSALTVVLLITMAIVFGWKSGSAMPSIAIVGGLAGFVGGIYRRREQPQPGPADIEADWSRRVQAGAFLDTMQFLVPSLMLLSWGVGWAHEAAPLVYLAALTALAGADYGVRYWRLRVKEQW